MRWFDSAAAFALLTKRAVMWESPPVGQHAGGREWVWQVFLAKGLKRRVAMKRDQAHGHASVAMPPTRNRCYTPSRVT